MRSILIAALAVMLGGCAEMLTAMSQVNAQNGAQCATYTVTPAVWDNGEYVENQVMYKPGDEYREKNWVEGRMDYYLSLYRFDMYYDTSPISGHDYRFNVFCTQYY